MDTQPRSADRDSLSALAVTGLGVALGAPCDPTPYLKARKLRKFMGLQDDLAVVAAGRALESAGLTGSLGERTGLYLAVGAIPFEGDEIDALHAASSVDGRFSMRRFATEGYLTPNPLLTFRCLPNMPAFHVSVSFDVQGPYFVTYPGPGQLYAALDEAIAALRAGAVDLALVAGVAHQKNFLVEHDARRRLPPRPVDTLRDAAGCLVLEHADRSAGRGARPRARLVDIAAAYRPWDPFAGAPPFVERLDGDAAALAGLGAASLPVGLAGLAAGLHRHDLAAGDGVEASSTWEIA